MKIRLFVPTAFFSLFALLAAIGYANEKLDLPGVKIGSDGSISTPNVNVGSNGSVSVSGKRSKVTAGSCVINEDSQILNLDCDGKQVVVNGDNNTINCGGKSPILSVNGDGNNIRFKGQCQKLSLNGEGNMIKIDLVGGINANGDNNTVTWASALTGARPAVVSLGDNNRIAKGVLD